MGPPRIARLFVCYVPGLDDRRITAERTPHLDRLRASHPRVGITTLPGAYLLPTLVSGVYPHEHRVWQVSLRMDARLADRPRLTDDLPDVVTTTLQCLRLLVDRSYDVATIPPRRRRQFDFHRFHGGRRPHDERALERMGNYRTVFGILAADARYRFAPRLESLVRLGDVLPSAECALEFLEVHAFDLFQHWHMDRSPMLDRGYRLVDDFVGRIHGVCQQRGVTLMVLVDHGQEPVTGALPLAEVLRLAPVRRQDYSHFVDKTLARFWFHTEEARVRLSEILHEMRHTRLLTRRDLRDLHIEFEDDAYGEVFLAADPGWIFFPHDFYHPLANLFLGLTDPDQRPRLGHPRLRGAHGYLPEHASERGFAILADQGLGVLRPEADLIDVAPTILSLLGVTPPAYMRGNIVFG
jgi:predicted AlkP superfamily pyrophosphatase or phosphodiesterase